jgi:RHS repeat-associated protein
LLTASSKNFSGTAWNREVGVHNEVMTYDYNGNIKTLKRYQRKYQLSGVTVSYVYELIDNLTYTYGGNIMTKVDDAITYTAGQTGFNNGSAAATEYTYNTAGSLIADANKGISSITYNDLGKPAVILFADARKVEYLYDAAGNKLTVKDYTAGSTTPQTTTDYVGSFVYENGVLTLFSSPEGRVVNKGGALEYQYSIADHQGNTRVVFSSATPAPDAPVASFEGDANDKASEYGNIPPGNVVSFASANHTTGGIKVLRMNQTTKIAATKSLHVYPGDMVDLEVWEYHEGSSGFGTTSTPASTLITMLAGAFATGVPAVDAKITSGVNSGVTAWGPGGGNQGDSRPAAYLNYILFDKNYNVLNMGWQLAPDATFTKQKLSFSTINIKAEGYLFAYLSYDDDSNNWVYFDDLKVTHTKTNVIQYNEYYPFGLQTGTSWTRTDSKNNFLYNQGSELNVTTGVYDLLYRNYDPVLGRFGSVDPLAFETESYSPFSYAKDNPIFLNDPLGLITWDELWPSIQKILEDEGGPGASWSAETGFVSYSSSVDGFLDTSSSITDSDGWGSTEYGSFEGSADAFYSGGDFLAMLRSVTIAASKMSTYSGEPYANSSWLQERIDELFAQQGIPGLLIDFRPDYSDRDNLGIMIKLRFKDPNNQFPAYGWIQTVRNNKPQNFPHRPPLRNMEPFNDTPGDDTPYYPVADYNAEGFNTIMADNPGRARNSAYVIWRAEVTIGGIKDGVFVPLGTMTYGFDIFDGKLDVIYPRPTQPTPWHVDSFTNKLKW